MVAFWAHNSKVEGLIACLGSHEIVLNQNRLTELIYCTYFHSLGVIIKMNLGMVVSWVLRLCVDSLWKTDLHTDILWTFLWANKNKRKGIKMSVTCKTSRHAVIFDFKYLPLEKNANVRHWRDSPFTANASKRGYGIWKSLEKKTVYVCVGHLKCLRISLVVPYNSEQCDRKHIHNLKSPSEEHLSFIFIFQCVLLSRIMHVGWNIIGEIMGVQI